MTRTRQRHSAFIATKEHRRFVEFADTVRRHATVGLCHGPAGVGKTMSGRRYSHWDLVEPHFADYTQHTADNPHVNAALDRARTVFYTPAVSATPNRSPPTSRS